MNFMDSLIKHCSCQLPLPQKTSGDCSSYKSFPPKIYASSSSGPEILNCSYHPLISKMNPLLSEVVLLTIPNGDTCLCSYYFCHQNCPSLPFLSILILVLIASLSSPFPGVSCLPSSELLQLFRISIYLGAIPKTSFYGDV